jgi:hypothetical protein
MRVAASTAASGAGGAASNMRVAASTAASAAGGAASTAQSTPATFKYWKKIFIKTFKKKTSLLNNLIQSCFAM